MADESVRTGTIDNDEEPLVDQLTADRNSAFLDDEELNEQRPGQSDGDDQTSLTVAHQGSRATAVPSDAAAEFSPPADGDLLDLSNDGANARAGSTARTASDAPAANPANGDVFALGLEPEQQSNDGAAAYSEGTTVQRNSATLDQGQNNSATPDQSQNTTGAENAGESAELSLFDNVATQAQSIIANVGSALNNLAESVLETINGTGAQETAQSNNQGVSQSSEQNAIGSSLPPADDEQQIVEAEPATATITVNDGPTTTDAAASGAEDAASISVTLTGSDVDGTVDSFSLSSLPTDGTLYTDAGLTTVAATGTDYTASGGSLTLYFVPDADYNGTANFDFAAKDDDGAVDATPATATITVTDVNDGPTARRQQTTVPEPPSILRSSPR